MDRDLLSIAATLRSERRTRLSPAAAISNNPMTGVRIRELIKYPKNPRGLCIPSTPISKQNTTYMKRNIIEPMLHLDDPNVNERLGVWRLAFTVHRSPLEARFRFSKLVFVPHSYRWLSPRRGIGLGLRKGSRRRVFTDTVALRCRSIWPRDFLPFRANRFFACFRLNLGSTRLWAESCPPVAKAHQTAR